MPNKPIPTGCCECHKCGGRGVVCFGGAVVNGRYTGKSGTCYACKGKGWQDKSDERRNAYYWNHVARISL
jgi:hypothetical protein